MSTEFRKSVWEGMVHADRLRRYYGGLAGRMAKLERAMTVVALVLALVTAFLANAEHALLLPAAILTAVATALPLIFRLGDRITEAAYCGKRLSDLSVGWEDLWQEAYGPPAGRCRRPSHGRAAKGAGGLDERDHRAEGAGARKQRASQGNPG